MKMKKSVVLVLFLAAGVVLGALVANLTQNISFLNWLSYGQTIGINAENPVVVDFAVLRVAFGLEIGVNVSQILFLLLGIVGYRFTVKRL